MTLRTSLLSLTALAGFVAAPAIAQTPTTTPHAEAQQQAQGTTGTRDASGGVMAQSNTTTGNTPTPRDGTPGNPPSTATQRAMDGVTGNRTPPDGTPGNPPGTAAGRAMDRTLGTNTTGTNPSGSSAVSGTTRDTHASTGAAASSSSLMPIESAALRNGRRASRMIGANLYNENNDSIGEVEDILMPMPAASTGGTAPTPVAIVSVGGFLGIGAKLVAVPYERLQWNGDRSRWTLSGATKESLTALPGFSYDGNERRG